MDGRVGFGQEKSTSQTRSKKYGHVIFCEILLALVVSIPVYPPATRLFGRGVFASANSPYSKLQYKVNNL